jgi:hypothetical protein
MARISSGLAAYRSQRSITCSSRAGDAADDDPDRQIIDVVDRQALTPGFAQSEPDAGDQGKHDDKPIPGDRQVAQVDQGRTDFDRDHASFSRTAGFASAELPPGLFRATDLR